MIPVSANAATLSLVSDTESVKIGQEITIDIKTDTAGVGINAAQATVQYPAHLLEPVSFVRTNSIFNFWLEEPNVDVNNALSFTAGSTNGFSGASLQIARIVFRAKANGTASIGLSEAAITAADGSGANVLSDIHGIKVLIAPAGESVPELPAEEAAEIFIPKPVQITRAPIPAKTTAIKPLLSVPFYPDPTMWHNRSGNFLASWELPADVSAVATAINRNPLYVPTESEGLFDSKMFRALPDGVSYLHVRFKNSFGWGATIHYRIAVDTAPPTAFEISVAEQNPTDVPDPTIRFASADSASGIDHYEIRINEGDVISTTNPSFVLPKLAPGEHTVRVYVFDRAGNATLAMLALSIIPLPSPIIDDYSSQAWIGEGNIYASGSTQPDTRILVALLDIKGQNVYTTEIQPGVDGSWTMRVDEPLKRGDYELSFIATDSRGRQSYPVIEMVRVRARPLLTLFGVNISESWFYVITSCMMIGAFIFGLFMQKKKDRRVARRKFQAEKDMFNNVEILKKDIGQLESALQKGNLDEVKFAADHIRKTVKQGESYVVESIRDISE